MTSTGITPRVEPTTPSELADEERRYASVHAPRLEFAVRVVSQLIARIPRRARVLDVGPHFLTEALRTRTDATVDQLGFRYDRATTPRKDECHHELDLNALEDRREWPRIGPYDVIVACELIEHLHISPVHVLQFFREVLAPGGHALIQTPNAVSLKRRIVMVLGRHPYELIRESPENPGHFREYTRDEIERFAQFVDLDVIDFASRSYFDYSNQGTRQRLYGWVTPLLPSSLRDGMTFVLRSRGRDVRR